MQHLESLKKMSAVFVLLVSSASFAASSNWPPAAPPILSQEASSVLQQFDLSGLTTPAFLSHDQGAFAYLADNLNIASITPVLSFLQTKSVLALRTRNEAHITVINPFEFNQILSQKMTMTEIDQIAIAAGLQSVRVRPLCLARSAVGSGTSFMETFYIPVEAPDLFVIRHKIAEAFAAKGGVGFDPDQVFFHVTVGFNVRDLQESDGITKSLESCMNESDLEVLAASENQSLSTGQP